MKSRIKEVWQRELKKSPRQNLCAIAVIVFIVLLGNAIYVTGVRDSNPLLQRSGLASNIVEGTISGENTIDPNDGFTSQALGHLAAESWLNGHVPYWNYYEGIGAPLAGEMQSAAMFPLVLLLHFSNGLLYMHIILEVVAGVATYYFLRRLSIRYIVALMGGMIFALNGTFAWLANAAVNPIAFLPLALLGVEIILGRANKHEKGGWTLLAVALALSIYAGFPETAYIDAIFVYGWALVRLIQSARGTRAAYIYKLAIGSVLGLLLATPILIAFIGYLPHAFTGQHNGGFADAALVSQSLSALIYPYIYGPIFGFSGLSITTALGLFWGSVGGYLSGSLLFGAITGVLSKRAWIIRAFLLAWILLCLGRIYGHGTILHIVNIIPGIKDTAFYRYSPPSLEFSCVILTAFGVDEIMRRSFTKKRLAIAISLGLALLVWAAIAAKPEVHTLVTASRHKQWAIVSVLIGVIAFTALGLSGFFRKRALVMAVIPVIFVSEAFLLFVIPELSTPKVTIDTAPVSFLKEHLGDNRFYSLGPIAPNYGSYYQLASVNENDLPVPKLWTSYVDKSLNNNTNSILFTGTYQTNIDGPTPTQEFVKNLSSYENVGVKYVIASGQINRSLAEQYDLQPVFSDSVAQIYALPHPSDYYVSPGSNCSFSSYTISSVIVKCPEQATIVRKELYMPGWSVNVNGRTETVSQRDNIFQAVRISAGSSKLTFHYVPPDMNFGIGAFILGAGIVCLAPGLSVSRKIRKRIYLYITTTPRKRL